MTGPATPFTLRELPASVRLALTLLLLVNLGGFLASGLHLEDHHENRDGEPGLTLDDLEGSYHGIEAPSRLRSALESGHPAEVGGELPDADREALLAWLASDSLEEDYDNLDLGDRAPAELLYTSCMECHKRGGSDPPLEYFDDVMSVAYSREVPRTPTEILITSTHTHAISLATLGLVLAALTWCTRWPAGLRGLLILLSALGLAGDMAGWWLARLDPGFVVMIVASGAVYALSVGVASILILLDLWRPTSR